MLELENILEEIESMEYPAEGIGCGLEDVSITDRYESAEYGWNEAVERITEIIRNHMNDGWIPVEKFGLPKSNEHDFRFWVTIQYVNGFRRTLKATWNYYNNHFVYQNGRVISEDVVAYKYYSAPEPYHSEGSNEHDGE